MQRLEALDALLTKCLHCGLCLPVCPTYAVTGREDASPRGRIRLMRSREAGEIATTPAFVEAMSYCLDCQACESACPAGVSYGTLLEHERNRIRSEGREPAGFRLMKLVVLRRLIGSAAGRRVLGATLRFYERSGLCDAVTESGLLSLLPRSVSDRHALLPRPSHRDFSATVRDRYEPEGAVRGTVALLTGCVMDIAFADLHRDTLEVLLRNGYRVLIPKNQPCCGSLHAHFGEEDEARALARKLIASLAGHRFDCLVVDSAGCAAFIKEYGRLLADDPSIAGEAERVSRSCREVTEFLVGQGYRLPHGMIGKRVTYHDPCHLVHTQKIADQPRTILRNIPGVEYTELPESGWCCGSAGLYNLFRPADGRTFLDRKLGNIAAVDPQIVATANPGCHLQIEASLRREGSAATVVHPVSLLNASYRNETSRADTVSQQ